MNLKDYLKKQGAPKKVEKAFHDLQKFVRTFDTSGKYKWDEELPEKIKGNNKIEEAFKTLHDYLYPPERMSVQACDETQPWDPHYDDRGLGWYGSNCTWHWYM